MALKIKNSNGEWVVDQKAIQTSIVDLEGNFEAENVEGALRELANKIKQLMYNTVQGTDYGSTGYPYRIEGFDVIGKTGTAQIYNNQTGNA